MATPALTLLRQAFPEATIDVLARPSVASVLQGNPAINTVFVADDRKLPREMVRELRAKNYEAISLFTNSLGSAWLAVRLGIRRRIGFARGGRSLLLNYRIPFRLLEWQTPTPKPLSGKSVPGPHEPCEAQHMVRYYIRIAQYTAQALGRSIPEQAAEAGCDLHLPVSVAAQQEVEELLHANNLTDKPLVAINPGAAYGAAKRWPAERLAAVAETFAGEGYGIVSTASPSESALTQAVQMHCKAPVVPLGEQLKLPGVAALLQRVSLLITNDSGPMHMAAALNVPTVAIFGPTDWNVTYPWQDNAVIVRNSPTCAPCFLRECPIDHRCMTSITAGEVVAAGKQLLSRVGAQTLSPGPESEAAP